MRIFTKNRRGFTLVELLVVIGIIAVLIGILLPVLSGVQARGRDIKCQSNLRQLVQAVQGYMAENKGSMPYGFYFNRSLNHWHPQGNPDPYNSANTWQAAPDNPGSSGDPDNDRPFISWPTLLGKFMIRGGNTDNDDFNFSPVLMCPEAQQSFAHPQSYVMNMIVAVMPRDEVRTGGGTNRWAYKPATQNLLLKEGTALVWDTAVQPDWGERNIIGYLGSADIDNQRFWVGARIPQWRYWTTKDIFGRFTPNQYGQTKPVLLGANFKNIDPDPVGTGNNPNGFPFQGNLRFRHNKNTGCNVGFSDGSVRQFTAKVNSDRTVSSHDAIRHYFMIKWPPGIPADQTVPF